MNIKQWIRSKTAWVAVAMGSLPVILEGYMPEIKGIISDKLGTEWGVVYGVVFSVAMIVMRSVTTEPISTKGVKSVQDNGSSENSGDDIDGGDHRGDESMDSVSETVRDPAAGVGQSDPRIKEAILREVTHRAKRSNRGKRRR